MKTKERGALKCFLNMSQLRGCTIDMNESYVNDRNVCLIVCE